MKENIFNKFNFKANSDASRNSIGLKTYYLVADKGLPNSNYIITPYSEEGLILTTQQRSFNYFISQYRVVAEICIGMLKLRFLILKERVNSTYPEAADDYIRACISLHNFSILNKDLLYRHDLDIDNVEENSCECSFCTPDNDNDSLFNYNSMEEYKSARRKLYDYFIEHHYH